MVCFFSYTVFSQTDRRFYLQTASIYHILSKNSTLSNSFFYNFSLGYIYYFFSVLLSLIIVSLLIIPPETITLQTIFEVIALHSNLLHTAGTGLIIHFGVSCLIKFL